MNERVERELSVLSAEAGAGGVRWPARAWRRVRFT